MSTADPKSTKHSSTINRFDFPSNMFRLTQQKGLDFPDQFLKTQDLKARPKKEEKMNRTAQNFNVAIP